jgi:acetoin utilization deacetylase AcuC-like enzyme
MRLTTAAFPAMTMDLRRVAEECCDGKLVAVTEGGYDLRATADSLEATIGALSAEDLESSSWPAPTAIEPSRARAAIAATKAALGRL